MLYILRGMVMRDEASAALKKSYETDHIWVSPVSAWELGKLVSLKRLSLTIDPLTLFNKFVGNDGFKLCQLTPEILVTSSFLPNLNHKDPMDLLLIATARTLDATLVTRDRAILAYGAAGHVKTLAC
jgi:PIN domain nuclease of toxin-antitoxin system